MASRKEGNKLPYEWFWIPAMVHLGAYACTNISQELKLLVDTVTSAGTHRYINHDVLRTAFSMQHEARSVTLSHISTLQVSTLFFRFPTAVVKA